MGEGGGLCGGATQGGARSSLCPESMRHPFRVFESGIEARPVSEQGQRGRPQQADPHLPLSHRMGEGGGLCGGATQGGARSSLCLGPTFASLRRGRLVWVTLSRFALPAARIAASYCANCFCAVAERDFRAGGTEGERVSVVPSGRMGALSTAIPTLKHRVWSLDILHANRVPFPLPARAPTARPIPAWANGPGHDRKSAKGLKARPMLWHRRQSVGRWCASGGWNGLSALPILARPCPGALPQAGMGPRRWR